MKAVLTVSGSAWAGGLAPGCLQEVPLEKIGCHCREEGRGDEGTETSFRRPLVWVTSTRSGPGPSICHR